MPRISSLAISSLAVTVLAAPVAAQDARCALPDTIIVAGNKRVTESTIRADLGIEPGVALNARSAQLALKAVFGSGQFDDVTLDCRLNEDRTRAALTVTVHERPILGDLVVTGPKKLGDGTVRDQIELLVGRPLDPSLIARATARIDSVYAEAGYFLVRVAVDTQPMANERVRLVFRIDEGRRLAVSGIRFHGNQKLKAAELAGALKTKPEGFWWWKKGEFNDEAYAGDLAERLPAYYADRGFIDFQIVKDSLIIDRERGKAMLDIALEEGPQYKVGSVGVEGNSRFSTPDVMRYSPFIDEPPTLSERVRSLLGQGGPPRGYFNKEKWEDATTKLRTAYSNEGYIYATVRPVITRRGAAHETPTVDLRWAIDERQPAIINRIDILGNDYTHEPCIRDQLTIVPGDVFNQDRLIRSYQNLGNLGFFEQPIPLPDTRTANDQGDVDIIFKVKEKKTGNVNFGASVGQAVGVGGFVGLDQPNLFGQCKRGSLQWQFGSYVNDFNLTYTDPSIKLSRVSGTVTAYRSQNRYQIADLGSILRIGGSVQIGFPVPGSYYTRFFVSYGGEVQSFGEGGLTSALAAQCNNCFRSTLGLTLQRDTRVDMPFASAGGLQTVTAEFSGGVLGGTTNFGRYKTELRAYTPLFTLGGSKLGDKPIKFLLGLTTKAGALFGDPGAFFVSQSFAMGGVQYGESLRGYPEFSITPGGYISNTSTYTAQRASFGNGFLSTTAEIGVRFSEMFYLNFFHDAGNVWQRPVDFVPSRLFRGAGVGLTIISPLGPIGMDYAYGFDRKDAFGRPAPAWQFHFRLGQQF